MGVMKVKQEDLIQGLECSGAAAFLDFAADADVTIFV
jgi:predicted peroxiredoxin